MASAGKLIVVMAFNETDDGDLVAAFEPRQIDNEDRAIRDARSLAVSHAGVIAWSRDADPGLGEYGAPKELFRHGKIPDLE